MKGPQRAQILIINLNFAANRYTESRYVTESFGRVTNYCCAALSGWLPRVAYSRHKYIFYIIAFCLLYST